jgi:hypothetical protein
MQKGGWEKEADCKGVLTTCGARCLGCGDEMDGSRSKRYWIWPWELDELAVRKAASVRGDGLPMSTGGHELSRRCRTCQNRCGDRWQRCAHYRLRDAPRKDRGYQSGDMAPHPYPICR